MGCRVKRHILNLNSGRYSSDSYAYVKGDRRILLFDLSGGGHHPAYIMHLIRYWGEREISGYLDIVVLPKFIHRHSDVVEMAEKYGQNRVKFVPITPAEAKSMAPRLNLLSRKRLAFQEWCLLCKYAELLKATHGLLMYFDTYQLPILLARRPPCLLSGIYFRPTFHYGDFEHYTPSWNERLRQWREKHHLSLVLRQPWLKTIFCLDPFVVKYFDQFKTQAKAVYLPDPVQIYRNSELEPEKLWKNLGINSSRKVFLLFGALNRRKGLYKLFDAIRLLPPELCQKFCLLLVGSISSKDKSPVQAQIEQLTQSLPVQIVTHDQFVGEWEIQAYFQIADFVLAPYQRHVGMSGILLLAAASQKPVLSSDYGLMREIVRRYELGLTVDSSVPEKISKGLTRFLEEDSEKLGNRTKMKSFAEQNSAEKFASVILQHL